MSHRHEVHDRSWAEEQREREALDVERDSDAPFERDVGDPRWGTGGMRGDERGPRATHDASERSWRGSPRRGVIVPARRSQVEWESGPPLGIPPEPPVSGPGPYVGLGPKGYRRSDERIREDVCERFTAHGDLDPTDVEVGVQGGEVMLSGTVSTRAQKRLAEDIVEAVVGVIEVHNHLRVRRLFVDSPTRAEGGVVAEGRVQEGIGAEHR